MERTETAGCGCRCTVWWADVDAADPALLGLLNPVELDRHASFRRGDDADRFLVGAALSRVLAGAALELDPSDVAVDRTCPRCGGPHGRPRIEGFHHSVAHSGSWVTVAVSNRHGVGVDIEEVVADHTVDRLGSRVLAAFEQEVLSSAHPIHRRELFTTTWARKEAFAKATGRGVAMSFATIDVGDPRDPGRHRTGIAESDESAPKGWVRDLVAPVSYRAAVAVLDTVGTDTDGIHVDERDAGALLGAACEGAPRSEPKSIG